MKKYIKGVAVFFCEFLLSNRYSRYLFNICFENAGSVFRSFVIRNVDKPSGQFIWKSKLLNNKYVNVPVGDDYKTWQFAYNYKWHDFPLTKVEKVLHDYYPLEQSYIDVGANHGLRCLYALSIKRRCIMFEPNKALNEFTLSVIKLNNFSNFKLENFCLSDRKGEAKFYLSSTSYMSSLDKNFASSDAYGGITGEIDVNVIGLDEYLEEYGKTELPCMIKIDAENNDFNVLKGAIQTIEKFKPSIIIEINDNTRNSIIEFMLNLDYSCFILMDCEKILMAYNPNDHNQFNGNKDLLHDLLFVADNKLIEHLQKLL